MVSGLKWASVTAFTLATGIIIARIEQALKVFNKQNAPFITAFIFFLISVISIIASLLLDNDTKKKTLESNKTTITDQKSKIDQLEIINSQAQLTSRSNPIRLEVTNSITDLTTGNTITGTASIKQI